MLKVRVPFLKSAGIAGLMVGAGAVLGGCSTGEVEQGGAPAENALTWDKEVDVVVCGSGTGGAPAAIEAHDAGAEVLIIEKKDWIGGSMRRCGGAMLGADTVVQHHLGITNDNPDMLYEYLLACGEGLTDPDLVRVLADNAGKNIDWVINDLGGQPVEEWDFTNPEDIDPGDRYYSDYTGWGDGTWVGRGGTGLWKPFENALTERGIEVVVGAGVRDEEHGNDEEAIPAHASLDAERALLCGRARIFGRLCPHAGGARRRGV